ncbi:nitrilase-related carbon-nitrogen hydrolase [Jiella mangrovi]|uniref:Hydrolase n=1 Tax=Jiella mangrovi TaxID=2821407 RepID=A0ABS4BG40_9HYPH|nr:hydrolase [Jiella mangrovi]
MKVAAIQLDAAIGDLAQRRATILGEIEAAAGAGAELVVLPELAVTGYGAEAAIRDTAAEAQPALEKWQKTANDVGIAVCLGLAVRTPTGLGNAAAFLAPGLAPVVYEKRMLYGDYEKQLFVPGSVPSPIVEIGGLRCGLLICFDVEFPELCRDLARRGGQAILVPTALPKSQGARFIAEQLVPVRAFENQLFIVYADHCGADARFAYQGQSVIAAPDGSALARAGESDPTLICATLDPANYAASRNQNPYLAEAAAAGLTF